MFSFIFFPEDLWWGGDANIGGREENEDSTNLLSSVLGYEPGCYGILGVEVLL